MAGDVEAQNEVGEMYHFGRGVKKDYQMAKKWYETAIQGNHAVAGNHLGRIYFNGEGVYDDRKKACEWYLWSAERNNPFAMNNVSHCYKGGFDGFEKNLNKSKKWQDRAKEFMHMTFKAPLSKKSHWAALNAIPEGRLIFYDQNDIYFIIRDPTKKEEEISLGIPPSSGK